MTADEWNAKYPNGTRVRYRSAGSEPVDTSTRSYAWALGHGEAVVAIHGRAGGVGLDFLEVIEAAL